jgi:antitoxin MazE
MCTSQKDDDRQGWFWSERWQTMEREADEDIAAGRIQQFASLDDLLTALDT